MRLSGNAAEIEQKLKDQWPYVPEIPAGVRSEMLPYQTAALFGLASRWNVKKARILEIGTAQGASAFMMSRAAPRAQIVTLNRNTHEASVARKHLAREGCGNVAVVSAASWDYLAEHQDERWHMVFVDGDHNAIARDMAWWNRLVPGGLFLCHDFSPMWGARPSPLVFEALNGWQTRLGRPFDVEILDDRGIGMAGFYRREGEVWSG